LADCRGDGIQCQPVRAETLLRDFDVNFEIPRTFKLDLGDPGFRQQPVARNFRGLTECPLVDVSEELQVKHAPAPGIERDPGPLRIVRKGRDTADGLLNVLEDPVVVAARLEFGNDPAGALVCSGADLLHAIDAAQFFLDGKDYAPLHLFGACTGQCYRNGHGVTFELREYLLLDLERGEKAAED